MLRSLAAAITIALALLALTMFIRTPASATTPLDVLAVPQPRWIPFESDHLILRGLLYKPEGKGPFPAIVWNHGSEKNPGASRYFDALAATFVPAGYVVFMPLRRGHGYSAGPYILDEMNAVRVEEGEDAERRAQVRLLETQQLDDQLAGLAALERTGLVDPQRIAVAGCSFGGIEALLAAERGVGYRAAVSLSPAVQSWEWNPLLRARLLTAVAGLRMPTLLLQPARDDSLEPAHVLGDAARRLGMPMTARIFPDTGPDAERSHCFGGAAGIHVWAGDVLAFLREQMSTPAATK